MSPKDDISKIINIEAAISKLLDKYKIVRNVFSGFIKQTKSGNVRILRVAQQLDEHTIPCIIIPQHTNTAVITLDILIAFVENLEINIRYLVIVNEHGVFVLSLLRHISLAKCQAIFKNKIFIERFFKANHEFKTLRRVLNSKYIILGKL